MNDKRQYLYTANGSYFGHCIVALAFVLPVVYGIIDRGGIDTTEANVMMFLDLSSCYSVFRLFRHATMPLMQFGQVLSRQN